MIDCKQYNSFLIIIILLAASCLAYSNSLHNDFMLDDHGLLLQEPTMHQIKYIKYQFVPDKNVYLQLEGRHHDVYYRPLQNTFLLICYVLFKENPFYYHALNLLLLVLCGLAFYCLVNLLFKDKNLSFVASLLFCTHPLNSLIVNYITASVFGTQLLALIGATILFIRFVEKKNNFLALAGSLFLFVIAMLHHETSMGLPFYLLITLWVLKKKPLRESFLKSLPFFIVLGVFYLLRLNFASLQLSILDKFHQFNITAFEYIASLTKIFLWYISKFFVLEGIVMIWATPVIKESLVGWLLIFILLFCFVCFIFYFRKRYHILAWSLAWLLMGFLPVTVACLFQPEYGFIIEPHWLFLGSLGMFVAIAYFLVQLRWVLGGKLYIILLFALIGILISQTRSLNRIFGDEYQYCRYWLKKSPSLKSILFYQADRLRDKGEYDQARKIYFEALEARSRDWQIYTNLGLMDYQQGHFKEAVDNFEKARIFFPESAIVSNNIGLVYFKQNQIDLAVENFEQAIRYNKFYLEPRLNLAQLEEKRNDWNEAARLYQENLAIDPHNGPSLVNLIKVYLTMGENKKAVGLGKRILESGRNTELLVELGNIFASRQYTNMALALYSQALKIDPLYKDAYLGLGKIYGNQDKFNQAIIIWQDGLRIDPNDERFKELILQAQTFQAQKEEVKTP